MAEHEQNALSASTRIRQTMKRIFERTKNATQELYSKGRQKSIDSYNAAKSIAGKGKQKSQQLYYKAKTKTLQTYQSIKAKPKNMPQQQNKSQQNQKRQIDHKQSLNQSSNPKRQLPKKEIKKVKILNELIRDLTIGTMISTFSALAIKNTVSFIGFKAFGIAKGSLAALYQSKVIVIYSKSLFAFLQSAAMKSVVVTYAPIVVPTIIVSYVGVKIVMNVVQSQKEKTQKGSLFQPRPANDKLSNNTKQKDESFQNTIQIQTLNNWMKKVEQNHNKTPQYTL